MEIPAIFSWLVLGGALQLLGFGRWMTPLAAWLAPVFLLHFTRALPPLPGMLWVWLAIALATSISLRGIVPIPGLAYLVLPISWGLLGALPFLIDRLVAPLMPGFWATLVFPVAWTAREFLDSRWNPYGTWGATAYTQHGVLPLMSLVSVTGLWGVVFLIGWVAATVNWAWGHDFAWNAIRQGILVVGGIAAAILLLGGIRLARSPEHKTVRVAGIGWPKDIIEPKQFRRALEPDLTPAERKELNAAFTRIQDSFLARSAREARAGAKIIVWPEANLIVFQEDEAAFLERARTLAREHRVWLLLAMATLRPGERYTFRNHALLLNPAGETAYDYTKITAVPGFEQKYSLPGDRPIPFADTEFGRLCSPICYDMDFDYVLRAVGHGHADLMLVPASDWKAIMPLHQQIAEFRAVENGAALFRITRWGGSGAVDPYGRRLAWMDDFAAQDNVMVAQMPVRAGVRTFYPRLGDVFGWSCVCGLAAGLLLFLLRALG